MPTQKAHTCSIVRSIIARTTSPLTSPFLFVLPFYCTLALYHSYHCVSAHMSASPTPQVVSNDNDSALDSEQKYYLERPNEPGRLKMGFDSDLIEEGFKLKPSQELSEPQKKVWTGETTVGHFESRMIVRRYDALGNTWPSVPVWGRYQAIMGPIFESTFSKFIEGGPSPTQALLGLNQNHDAQIKFELSDFVSLVDEFTLDTYSNRPPKDCLEVHRQTSNPTNPRFSAQTFPSLFRGDLTDGRKTQTSVYLPLCLQVQLTVNPLSQRSPICPETWAKEAGWAI